MTLTNDTRPAVLTPAPVPDTPTPHRLVRPPAGGPDLVFRGKALAVAGLLAVGLVGSLSWAGSHLADLRSVAGPDYRHDSPADRARDATCNPLTATYVAWRCSLYLQADTARELQRTPTGQGGTCPLGTPFACARLYHLPPHDQDVPLWRPWSLRNGPAGTAFNATAGALLALTMSGAVHVMAGPGSTSRRRSLAGHAEAAGWGAAAGVLTFTVGRHAEYALPGIGGALPFWALPTAAVLAAAGVLAARRARTTHPHEHQTGGTR